MVPRGPVIVICVGEGAMVTEGGNLMGSRPMMETFFDRNDVELNWRTSFGIGPRTFMCSILLRNRDPTRDLSEWSVNRV